MSDTATPAPRKIKRLEGVEYLPISQIKVNRSERLRRNIKEIEENAGRIFDSLILVGPIQPLLVDEDNNLIDGECRYTAYTKLNQTEVPVVRRVKLEQAMK